MDRVRIGFSFDLDQIRRLESSQESTLSFYKYDPFMMMQPRSDC